MLFFLQPVNPKVGRRLVCLLIRHVRRRHAEIMQRSQRLTVPSLIFSPPVDIRHSTPAGEFVPAYAVNELSGVGLSEISADPIDG